MKLVRERGKRRRSGGAKSGKSATRKTRSAAARIERELTKREKRSAYASKRSEKSMRRAEKPVSRRSAQKTRNESAAYERSLTEIEVGAIVVVAAVAGLLIVIGIVADETGADEEVGPGLGLPNAAYLSSLKTSKWTMIWHYNFYYRKANR
jgi:sRNA-binding protein